ncbi:MAG: DUF4381 domain-containing protein [bacterium]
MQSDPLQQLRDVHLPPDPSWWPPAYGWWLLAAVSVAAVIWLSRAMIRSYKKRAPSRAAGTQLAQLYSRYQAGEISATQYLHNGNELLKRLLVRAYRQQSYARLSGDAWLQVLDELSGSSEFSTGAASVLGNSRYSAQPQIDVDQLHTALKKVIAKVKP